MNEKAKPRKAYTVRFYEYAAYRATVIATSSSEAIRKVYTQYSEEGGQNLHMWDNGTEDWTVDTKGETVLEINHPEDLEDDCTGAHCGVN